MLIFIFTNRFHLTPANNMFTARSFEKSKNQEHTSSNSQAAWLWPASSHRVHWHACCSEFCQPLPANLMSLPRECSLLAIRRTVGFIILPVAHSLSDNTPQNQLAWNNLTLRWKFYKWEVNTIQTIGISISAESPTTLSSPAGNFKIAIINTSQNLPDALAVVVK